MHPMEAAERKLAVLHFMRQLSGLLEGSENEEKLLRVAVRAAAEFCRADCACLATLEPGQEHAALAFSYPPQVRWDLNLLGAFLRGRTLIVPANVLLGVIRRRGRSWGVLGLQRTGLPFDRRELRALTPITTAISNALERVDQKRLWEVRGRIDRKIMEQLRPRDLFYQILHGLRSLTRYDHSSALLISTDGGATLELAAEQIAVFKGKSHSIGRRFVVDDDLRRAASGGEVFGFERHADEWREWRQRAALPLATLLDYNQRAGETDADGNGECALRREAAMIVAPITSREGLIGLIKVAALRPGTLGAYEAGLLPHFIMQTSVGIQYLQRTESLESKMVAAERRHAMASLARVVSHDVNNALGSALPLAQELLADARAGELNRADAVQDLEQIEESLQFSRRLFTNMVATARPTGGKLGTGNLRRAIDGTLAMLRRGLERSGIALVVEIADDLPPVQLGHDDLTKLFLNLVTNAAEAMPKGGTLTVRARRESGNVLVDIVDTGCGIPPEHLARLGELFFTTKEAGNGMGLSICRAILHDADGDLHIESASGRGTTARVTLPAAESRGRAGDA